MKRKKRKIFWKRIKKKDILEKNKKVENFSEEEEKRKKKDYPLSLLIKN